MSFLSYIVKDVRLILWPGLIGGIFIVGSNLLSNPRSANFLEILYSWGLVLAFVLGVSIVCQEYRVGREGFWRSRPGKMSEWIGSKIFVCSVLMFIIALLSMLRGIYDANDIFIVRYAWRGLSCYVPMLMLVFTMTVFVSVLVRKTVQSMMVALTVFMFVSLGPVVIESLSFMKVFHLPERRVYAQVQFLPEQMANEVWYVYPEDIENRNYFDTTWEWARYYGGVIHKQDDYFQASRRLGVHLGDHALLIDYYPEYWSYLGWSVLGTLVCVLGAYLLVRKNIWIEVDQKRVLWGFAAVGLGMFFCVSEELGTNLKELSCYDFRQEGNRSYDNAAYIVNSMMDDDGLWILRNESVRDGGHSMNKGVLVRFEERGDVMEPVGSYQLDESYLDNRADIRDESILCRSEVDPDVFMVLHCGWPKDKNIGRLVILDMIRIGDEGEGTVVWSRCIGETYEPDRLAMSVKGERLYVRIDQEVVCLDVSKAEEVRGIMTYDFGFIYGGEMGGGEMNLKLFPDEGLSERERLEVAIELEHATDLFAIDGDLVAKWQLGKLCVYEVDRFTNGYARCREVGRWEQPAIETLMGVWPIAMELQRETIYVQMRGGASYSTKDGVRVYAIGDGYEVNEVGYYRPRVRTMAGCYVLEDGNVVTVGDWICVAEGNR